MVFLDSQRRRKACLSESKPSQRFGSSKSTSQPSLTSLRRARKVQRGTSRSDDDRGRNSIHSLGRGAAYGRLISTTGIYLTSVSEKYELRYVLWWLSSVARESHWTSVQYSQTSNTLNCFSIHDFPTISTSTGNSHTQRSSSTMAI